MREKVLLFACIEQNIGDDLFIYTICKRYPQIDFVISSEAEYGDLRFIPNLRFSSTFRKWQRVSSLAIKGKIINSAFSPFRWFLRRKLGEYSKSVYIVGNTFKCPKYLGEKGILNFKNIIKITEKFYLISTNFGPYIDRRWVRDLNEVFGRVEDVCFRDRYSYNLYKKFPNVRYAPDAILSNGFKKNTPEKTILISVIDCLLPNRVIPLDDYREIYENLMTSIADFFIKKGFKVYIVNSNDKQDNPASKRIVEHSRYSKQISIFHYEGNFNAIFELYSKAKYVVATRLHTIVLALLYGIPCLPISYDQKVEYILRDYKFKGKWYRISELDDICVQRIERDLSLNAKKKQIDKSIIEESCKQWQVLDEVMGE